jgi:hypothetical protein
MARATSRTIGIAQLFAFGIRNQFVADTGVEEILRHWSNPLHLEGSK